MLRSGDTLEGGAAVAHFVKKWLVLFVVARLMHGVRTQGVACQGGIGQLPTIEFEIDYILTLSGRERSRCWKRQFL